MSNTNLLSKSKYSPQELKFQEYKLNVIKLTITRLFMVGGVWTLFFMLYNINTTETLSFQPIIIALLAIYALGELIFMFYDIRLINKN